VRRDAMKVSKVPLRLEPQPEGGYTVTSPALHGLVTEGETVAEALELVLEDDEAEGTLLPEALRQEAEAIELDDPVVRP
jgi:predicted RNase H-like HicB family nuclease